jgi:hypothetical protein
VGVAPVGVKSGHIKGSRGQLGVFFGQSMGQFRKLEGFRPCFEQVVAVFGG